MISPTANKKKNKKSPLDKYKIDEKPKINYDESMELPLIHNVTKGKLVET
jgi:hypothetical protein